MEGGVKYLFHRSPWAQVIYIKGTQCSVVEHYEIEHSRPYQHAVGIGRWVWFKSMSWRIL